MKIFLFAVFCSGGHNIKRLMAETGVQVTSDPDNVGVWNIFAPNRFVISALKWKKLGLNARDRWSKCSTDVNFLDKFEHLQSAFLWLATSHKAQVWSTPKSQNCFKELKEIFWLPWRHFIFNILNLRTCFFLENFYSRSKCSIFLYCMFSFW